MKNVKGDYLGFLNSDDVYLPEALMTLKNYIIKKITQILFLVLLKNIGEFCMVINLGK